MADDPATVSTYHAFAGHPAARARPAAAGRARHPAARARPSCGSWPFASCASTPSALDTEKSPAAITAMVLRLAGSARRTPRRHRRSCATPTSSSNGWCTRCRPGPYQRDRGPSQWLLRMLATQTERTELVPLIDALHAADAGRQGHGLRHADGLRRPGWRRRSRRSGSSCGSATGWCCSTSTRTPATPSGSRCRRCSAAGSTTISR